MQTFLPFADFAASAEVLDTQRLGKQREEAATLLETLVTGKGLWLHSGCAEMWKGAEISLWKYTVAICNQWMLRRDRADDTLDRVQDLMMGALRYGKIDVSQGHTQPWWLGKESFHLAHRSALIQKMPAYYRPKFSGMNVPDNLPMVWPEWREPVPVPA